MKRNLKIIIAMLLILIPISVVQADEIDSISIYLETAITYPGDNSYIRSTVTGTASDTSLTYSMTGNNSSYTRLTNTQYGMYIHVGQNETSSKLTIIATSNADPSKTASLEILLSEPTIINEINFTYDTASAPFKPDVTIGYFKDWVIANVGTTTDNIRIFRNNNTGVYYLKGTNLISPNSSDLLGIEDKYAIMFGSKTESNQYSYPSNVKALNWDSNVAITSLSGFTVKLNGVVRNDAIVSYNENWNCAMIYIPIGKTPYHNVQFNTNGGTTIDSQFVLDNNMMIQPIAPTKEDYTFVGWYKDAELTQEFDFNTPVKYNMTLYAKWQESRNIKLANVLGIVNKTYNGKYQTQNIKVIYDGKTLVNGTDYTITYKNNKNVGTATITIVGKGNYIETITKTFKINKANNPLAVKASTKIVKYSKVRKAKQVVKAISVTKYQGKLTYTKQSGSKTLLLNKTTGKLTVKKGTKKGTYKIKVKVYTSGNSNYKSAYKIITIKVRVK